MLSHDILSLIARLLLGGFFLLARFRFFYDPARGGWLPPSRAQLRDDARWLNAKRHASLRAKMCHCGYTSRPYLTAWIVALAEVLGGIAVVFGFLTYAAAGGLLLLTLIATRCTWREKIFEQKPVDLVDCVCCYLWRVEGLYIGLATIVLLAGPGLFSIDHFLF